MHKLTVACVEYDNYLGRGAEYVDKLHRAVQRNLNQPFTFECIRESTRPGWWSKLELFRPGRFEGRVLYLDLDTLIVGPLDRLAASKGILHLGLWGWKKNDYGSGVMVWDAGEHEEIWTQCPPDVQDRFRGDQDWLTHLGGWDALPDDICVSYKYHCKNGPPNGVSVVCFHGTPKPHELTNWVAKEWR